MRNWCLCGLLMVWGACAAPQPGPDKQFAGTLKGAAMGAGTGAVTGLQIGAGTGPGAAVGAGFGAVAGGIQGFIQDQKEEDWLALSAETQRQREIAYAQHLLQENYQRRVELHPSRDLYPADLFFEGDNVILRPGAAVLVGELARLNKNRFPYSRLVIASYVKTVAEESEYAYYLGSRRCQVLGDQFVRAGIEPRRIETRVVLVNQPLLIDPQDRPDRFNQAIELIAVDR